MADSAYYCPMHADVSQATPGKCGKCGMDLIAEGARFPFLRHVLGNPLHIAVMVIAMVAVMAAAMMLMR